MRWRQKPSSRPDSTDSAGTDLIGSAAQEDAPMVQQPTQNTPDANAAPRTIAPGQICTMFFDLL
ncbi:MAG: hypothetical protein LIO58_06275 [Oscillospiraceae bacterium]|nr:hypothetical protein [Oscillospiraceae bacterium]